MMQRWDLTSKFKLDQFYAAALEQIEIQDPWAVQITKPSRSISQNAMIYLLYAKIASQQEGWTEKQVRDYCKLHYGVGILKSHNPEWAEEYDQYIKGEPYEKKLWLVGQMDITSLFDKDQATDYINTIIQEWGRQGVVFD